MRLDDLRPTENVDDRRGGFGGSGIGGRHIAVGGGGLGLVGIVVLALLFGVDPSQLLNGTDTGGTTSSYTQNDGSPRADDTSFQFARKIVGSAEDVWQPLLRQGRAFTPATLTTYNVQTPTACGEDHRPGRSIARATIASISTCRSSTSWRISSARRQFARAVSSRTSTATTSRTSWAR